MGQWKVSALSIYSAASAVRLAIFQPRNMSKIEGWQKAQKLKGKCDRGIRVVGHCDRGICASQAGNRFLKSPSISLRVNGYAKIILRQRKC